MTIASAVHALPVGPRGPLIESCRGSVEPAAYRKCLQAAAAGVGLAAEAALFELGMLAHDRGQIGEAVRLFQSYAERFPEGVLAPEASIALMVDLRHSGRLAEATAEAARFPLRFATEPRLDDVRRWASQIP